jgi:MFS family permease
MTKVAVASAAGTTIEYYDFYIYGTAAALVFPTVFFPALGPAAGTIASFATFAVAFLARPLGAVIFGHYGDKLGRKKTLVSTLTIMGLATVLVGLLPSASTIGVLAPILVIALGFGQGLAVGGEWAGAVLLAAEYAPARKRGLYAAFPQTGPAFAFALSCATFLITNLTLGDQSEAFMTYGWRIPFLLSGVLLAIGMYIRLTIGETPVFASEMKAAPPAAPRRLPVLEVLIRQPREVVLAAGSLVMLFGFFYIGTAFLTSYGTSSAGLGLTRPTVLALGLVGSVFFAAGALASGWVSDHWGRRRVVLGACLTGIPWSLALFPILQIGTPLAFGVGLSGTLLILSVAYGPAGSHLPELFRTRYRYTGAGMAYSLAGVLGGGIVPIVAAAILPTVGGTGIGLMLAGTSVLSVICTLALRETKGNDLTDSTEDAPVGRAAVSA